MNWNVDALHNHRVHIHFTICSKSCRLGMFNHFFNMTDDALTTRLSVVFRLIIRLGSFPAC